MASNNHHHSTSNHDVDDRKFPRLGASEAEVLRSLTDRLKGDMTFDSKRIIGSMISPVHPFANRVAAMYLEKNVSDQGVFPATAAIEEEVIQMLGDLLHGPSTVGNVLTGGV